MKKTLILLSLLLITIVISSCKSGDTYQTLKGNELGLPDELKGLKVYSVRTEGGGLVRVGLLNNTVNSLTYTEGKTTSTTIIINKDNYCERTIIAKEILSENDSIIVIKKQ